MWRQSLNLILTNEYIDQNPVSISTLKLPRSQNNPTAVGWDGNVWLPCSPPPSPVIQAVFVLGTFCPALFPSSVIVSICNWSHLSPAARSLRFLNHIGLLEDGAARCRWAHAAAQQDGLENGEERGRKLPGLMKECGLPLQTWTSSEQNTVASQKLAIPKVWHLDGEAASCSFHCEIIFINKFLSTKIISHVIQVLMFNHVGFA